MFQVRHWYVNGTWSIIRYYISHPHHSFYRFRNIYVNCNRAVSTYRDIISSLVTIFEKLVSSVIVRYLYSIGTSFSKQLYSRADRKISRSYFKTWSTRVSSLIQIFSTIKMWSGSHYIHRIHRNLFNFTGPTFAAIPFIGNIAVSIV